VRGAEFQPQVGDEKMSWFNDNVTVTGTPVNGMVNISFALPGMNKTIPTNIREAVVDVQSLDQENAEPQPVQNEFYPILSSMKW
jgi:hypothetical protein